MFYLDVIVKAKITRRIVQEELVTAVVNNKGEIEEIINIIESKPTIENIEINKVLQGCNELGVLFKLVNDSPGPTIRVNEKKVKRKLLYKKLQEFNVPVEALTRMFKVCRQTIFSWLCTNAIPKKSNRLKLIKMFDLPDDYFLKDFEKDETGI